MGFLYFASFCFIGVLCGFYIVGFLNNITCVLCGFYVVGFLRV